MSKANKKDRELWRGDGVSIGVYSGGFTVSEVLKTGPLNKQGKPAKNAGQERLANQTYHGKLHQALNTAANIVAAREATTLKGYMDTFESAAKQMESATLGQ